MPNATLPQGRRQAMQPLKIYGYIWKVTKGASKLRNCVIMRNKMGILSENRVVLFIGGSLPLLLLVLCIGLFSLSVRA